MSVSWVGAVGDLCPTFDSATGSISLYAPAVIDNDALFAVLWGDGTIAVPSGWTKIAELSEVPTYYASSPKQCFILRKDTVTTAAAGFLTFTRSGSYSYEFSGVVFAARGVVAIPEIKQRTDDWYEKQNNNGLVPLESATATADGELHVLIGLSYWEGPNSPACLVPAGATRWSTPWTGSFGQAIGGAFIARNNGQTSSGTIDLAPTGADVPAAIRNPVATFTLRLSPTSGAPAPIDSSIQATTMLGASSALGTFYERQVMAAMPAMLGVPRVLSTHDFYNFLSDDPRHLYTMELQTSTGAVRVPISSWQATLNAEDASFVQCVVPAADRWIDELDDAGSFVIFRKTTLIDGRSIEVALAGAPLETLSFADGRVTATLQGYLTDLLVGGSASPALAGILNVFVSDAGIRVRCAIDWQLKPGMICYYNGTPIVVEYINYYVTQGQAYMDVGGT